MQGYYESVPQREYRTPGAVRRDVLRIKENIETIKKRMDLRTLLVDILSDDRAAADPDYWIPELSEALEVARTSGIELHILEKELEGLYEELREVKWIYGS